MRVEMTENDDVMVPSSSLQNNCSFSMTLDSSGGGGGSAGGNNTTANTMVTIASGGGGDDSILQSNGGGQCRFIASARKFQLNSSRSVLSVAAAASGRRQLRCRVQVTLAKPSDGCDDDWIRIASDKCAKILRENRTDPCLANGAQLMTVQRREVDTKLQNMILNR